MTPRDSLEPALHAISAREHDFAAAFHEALRLIERRGGIATLDVVDLAKFGLWCARAGTRPT